MGDNEPKEDPRARAADHAAVQALQSREPEVYEKVRIAFAS
jgi:hypothetical protein